MLIRHGIGNSLGSLDTPRVFCSFLGLPIPNNPETSGCHRTLAKGSEGGLELSRVFESHVVASPQNAESIVEREERLQNILLCPEAVLPKHPVSGVLRWQENVVCVH